MIDNEFDNINLYPLGGQVFQFDETIISNNNISNKNYATANVISGALFSPPFVIPSTINYINDDDMYATSFTAYGDDPTSVIYLTDDNGNSLAGFDVIQIEHEIKPYKNSEWQWEKLSGKLTLVNPINKDETLFILYQKSKN